MQDSVVVDGYTIHLNKLLGSGQYGKVYECTSSDQKQQLCAKIVCVTDEKSANAETDILQVLLEKAKFNTNVVKIMKVIYNKEQKKMVVIMEKCLSNLQKEWEGKNKLYSNEETREVLKQLLIGYKMLYDHNILHRDIKPENILINSVSGKSIYKLADFGVGKIYKQNDYNITKTGTPVYAAPEINQLVQDPSLPEDLKSKNVLKSNIDIFSIGIILYQLLFGKIPFETTLSGIQRFFQEIKYKDFLIQPNHNKDPQLISTIESMLKYLPSQRVNFETLYLQYLNAQIEKPIQLTKNFKTMMPNNKFQNQIQQGLNPLQNQQPQQINYPNKPIPNFINTNNFNQQQPQQGNLLFNQQNTLNPQINQQQQYGNPAQNQQWNQVGGIQQQGQRQFTNPNPVTQPQPKYMTFQKDEFLEEFKSLLQFLIDIQNILQPQLVSCLQNISQQGNKDAIKQYLQPLKKCFTYNKNQSYGDIYVKFYFALIYYTEDTQIPDPLKMSLFNKRQYLITRL